MIDFNSIVRDSKLYNFHSHTQFCDGKDIMENFIIEAIAQGFTHYGFSPHSPLPIKSPCNMDFDNVPEYSKLLDNLKDKYGKHINIYKSMEIDYLDESWGPDNDYFDELNLDYKIGSVHFIPTQFGDYIDIDGRFSSFKIKMEKYFNNDIEYVVRTFYSQTIKMIEAGHFDIIGHFDKIGHNASHFKEGIEDEIWYNKLVEETIKAIAHNNIILEVNTKAWEEHNRFFPNIKYFNLLSYYNIPILLNSDAHHPNLINAGRFEAMKLLK